MKKLLIASGFFIYILSGSTAFAQGTGSVETIGTGPLSVFGAAAATTKASASETLYIGPGTHQIDGTWEIYSKNILIDPNAVITGTGTMVFYNPSVAGGTASATLIDGNNSTNAIAVNISLQNASGMQLINMDFPAALTGAGFTNNSTSSTLYIGTNLNLAVNGANVLLGTTVVGDLRFDNDATLTNYSPDRMIVTNNSVLSHIVKDAYTGSFTFPVGIAEGNYTPAQIDNAISNGIHVSVQNYAASAPDDVQYPDGDGMDRTWNIYADNASGNSTVMLQHNGATNQTAFIDGSHFVTRYGAIPNNSGDNASQNGWQSNTLGAGIAGNLSSTGTIAGSSMRSRGYTDFATTAATDIAYFSKSSNTFTPLPVGLVNFTGTADKCEVTLSWKTATENNVHYFDIERSLDGALFTTIGRIQANNNSDGARYSYTALAASNTEMYRLSVVGIDGKNTRSKIVIINNHCNEDDYNSWSVYPNPTPANTNATIRINMASSIAEAKLVVVNILGQILVEKEISIAAGLNSYNLPIPGWPKGSYMISIVDNTGKQVMRATQLVIK